MTKHRFPEISSMNVCESRKNTKGKTICPFNDDISLNSFLNKQDKNVYLYQGKNESEILSKQNDL